MGRMIRQHWWIPALRCDALVADGRPERVRLFGRDYVAFRATSGRVGFFDEACPHRGASLALARNEDDALRCIYHGWKFRVDGVTLECPTQPHNQEEVCRRVPLRHYPVREEGGVVWVWLGEGGKPPKFVDLPFTGLSGEHCVVHRQQVGCNWVQGLETTMDSAHVGVLHQSWLQGAHATVGVDNAPLYHYARKDYGYRYAAVRKLPDGRSYVRIHSFVMPWFTVILPRTPQPTRAQLFFFVPIDDESHWYWTMNYDAAQPIPYEPDYFPSDRDAWPPVASRDAGDHWGQDRIAMANGHFSGFTQTLGTEDFAIILSQGTTVDRTREFLGPGDGAIVQLRRCLLSSVREFIEGRTPMLAQHDKVDYSGIRPHLGTYASEAEWRKDL